MGLEINGSKCELNILNDSMPDSTEGFFRGFGWLKHVTFHCGKVTKVPVDTQGIPGTIC